jgi:hypothetical protein
VIAVMVDEQDYTAGHHRRAQQDRVMSINAMGVT